MPLFSNWLMTNPIWDDFQQRRIPVTVTIRLLPMGSLVVLSRKSKGNSCWCKAIIDWNVLRSSIYANFIGYKYKNFPSKKECFYIYFPLEKESLYYLSRLRWIVFQFPFHAGMPQVGKRAFSPIFSFYNLTFYYGIYPNLCIRFGTFTVEVEGTF